VKVSGVSLTTQNGSLPFIVLLTCGSIGMSFRQTKYANFTRNHTGPKVERCDRYKSRHYKILLILALDIIASLQIFGVLFFFQSYVARFFVCPISVLVFRFFAVCPTPRQRLCRLNEQRRRQERLPVVCKECQICAIHLLVERVETNVPSHLWG